MRISRIRERSRHRRSVSPPTDYSWPSDAIVCASNIGPDKLAIPQPRPRKPDISPMRRNPPSNHSVLSGQHTTHLAPSARRRGLLGCGGARSGCCSGALLPGGRLGGSAGRDLFLALAEGFRRGRVPVVDHLRGEHAIQHKARHEAVQDQLVVHLLEGREDARERAGEVVEDLPNADVRQLVLCARHPCATVRNGKLRRMDLFGERASRIKNAWFLEPLGPDPCRRGTHEFPTTMGK